jgi:hypothetical protein
MSKALLEKLRRSREFGVAINGNTFTVRRPTDADVVGMPQGNIIDYVHRFVVGWDLTELQVVAGGGPEPVPFDPILWAEWVDDQPDVWREIGAQIMEAYQKHRDEQEAAAKN